MSLLIISLNIHAINVSTRKVCHSSSSSSEDSGGEGYDEEENEDDHEEKEEEEDVTEDKRLQLVKNSFRDMSRVIQMSRVLFCMSANLNTLLPFRNYCVCGNDTAKENDHEHTEALKSNDRSTDLWATVLPETNSFLTSMNHQNSMTVSKLFDIPSAIRSLLCPEPTNGRRHGICQVS